MKESFRFLFKGNGIEKIDSKYEPKHLKMIMDLERSWRATFLTDCLLIEQKYKSLLADIWGEKYFKSECNHLKHIKRKTKKFKKTIKVRKRIIEQVKLNTKNKNIKPYFKTSKLISKKAPWLILDLLSFGVALDWVEGAKDQTIKDEITKSMFSSKNIKSRQEINNYFQKIKKIKILRNAIAHNESISSEIKSEKIGKYLNIIHQDLKIRANNLDRYQRRNILERNNDKVSKELYEKFLKKLQLDLLL